MTQQGWVSAETNYGQLVVFRVDKINTIVKVEGESYKTVLYMNGDDNPFYLRDEFNTFFAKVSQAHLPLV